MSRKIARDWAFKLVFELCFQESSEILYEEFLEENGLSDENVQFVKDIYSGVAEYKDELLQDVQKYIKGYTIDRLFKVDLAILLIAFYEIKYMKKSPVKVVANEAVELSKKYSTPKSYSFINGVIGSFAKESE